MLKKLALAALLAAGSSVAMADNDVGCGVGTQVWAGQKGVVPKILAATTNGIFTNQLLGITRYYFRYFRLPSRWNSYSTSCYFHK